MDGKAYLDRGGDAVEMVIARAMARYVDPNSTGPVIELGPGTGPVTEALVRHGVDPRVWSLSSSILISAGCCARVIRRRPSCRAMPTGCGACWRPTWTSPPLRLSRDYRSSPSRCARGCV